MSEPTVSLRDGGSGQGDDSLTIVYLYPRWRPGRRSYAMDVLGRGLAASMAESHQVMMLSRGSGGEMDGRAPIRFVGGTADRLLSPAINRLWRVGSRMGLVPPSRPLSSSRWAFPGYAAAAAREVRRIRAHVAHIHIYDQLVPLIRRASPSTAIVLHMHDHSQLQQEAARVSERLEQCDLVVGCSRYLAEAARTRFPGLSDRIDAIPNSIPDPRPRRANPKGMSILFVGRLSPEKGVHVLMEAFNQVARSHPAAALTLIGPSSVPAGSIIESHLGTPPFRDVRHFYKQREAFRPYLEDLIAEEYRNRVEFLGELPNIEASERLRGADLLVLPSIWNEPFGLPVLEAMAAGIPVIATRLGAFPDVVVDGVTGLLVEPGEVDGLAVAMTEILSDPRAAAEMGNAGRVRAAEQFGWENYVDAWDKAYRRIAGD